MKKTIINITTFLFGGVGLLIIPYIVQNSNLCITISIYLICIVLCCLFTIKFHPFRYNDHEKLFHLYGYLEKNDKEVCKDSVIYNEFKEGEDYPVQFYWSDARGTNSISSHMMNVDNENILRIIVDDNEENYEASNIAIKPESNTPKEFNNVRFLVISLKKNNLDFTNKPLQNINETNDLFFNLRLVDKYHRHWNYIKKNDTNMQSPENFKVEGSDSGWPAPIKMDFKEAQWVHFYGDGNCINIGIPNQYKKKPNFSIITSVIFSFGKKTNAKVKPFGKHVVDINYITLKK